MDGLHDSVSLKFRTKKEVSLFGAENVVFKPKCMNIEAGKYVVLMNVNDAKIYGLMPGDRVQLKKGRKSITCVVDLTKTLVKPKVMGIFKEVKELLNLKKGDSIQVSALPTLPSVEAIVRKIHNEKLTDKQISSIINDVVHNNLTEAEVSAFLVAAEINGLSLDETVALTNAMVNSGEVLNLNKKFVLDKHCIGGVAGNRTTMVVVPIIAAAGFYIPKTSSRAITSPAGTADTMEVLAEVEFSMEELKKLVTKAKGAIVWGGGVNIAPADDKMIQLRRPLHLDPLGVMLASILGKKKAVGANHLIIDIPTGRGAKVEDVNEARNLARKFKEVTDRLNIKTNVLITDGSEPVGNGIGPILEARDVLMVLAGDGPLDLREKALLLAGKLLELTGKYKVGEGYGVAKSILDSGKALKKMRQIIELQGGNGKVKVSDLQPGKYTYDIKATKKGRVEHIDNKNISRIARAAGAPFNKGAGIYLHKVKGDFVKKGEAILTIYAESETKLSQALKVAKTFPPFLMEKMFIDELL